MKRHEFLVLLAGATAYGASAGNPAPAVAEFGPAYLTLLTGTHPDWDEPIYFVGYHHEAAVQSRGKTYLPAPLYLSFDDHGAAPRIIVDEKLISLLPTDYDFMSAIDMRAEIVSVADPDVVLRSFDGLHLHFG
jgi:hypothetical protein